MQQIITADLFNISNRLKKIDKNYFIIFNHVKKVYEVHYKNQSGSTFCFSVEKKYLNSEVITKAHKTNVRNAKGLLSEIFENNKKLSEKSENYLKEKSESTLKSFITYANKKGSDCSFENANKTIWV